MKMACLSLKMIGKKSLDEAAKKNAQIEHEPVFIDSMNLSENVGDNNERIEKYEAKIFQSLNKHFDRNYVYIKNKSLKIWTLSFNKQSTNTPIVFVHGACCSIGLWALNIANISDTNPIYAFDTLGFGRSSRPKFGRDPVVIENQFVDSIEDWRLEMGLEKVILIGHSFGGYLSTSYALKYPQHVIALILVDPWGFSEKKPPNEIPISLRAYAKCGRYFTPTSFFRKFGQFGLSMYKSFYSPDIKYKFESLLGQNNTIYKYIYYSNNKKPR
jgi:pimeloyl-ACP methyl ester carboxylesterase